MAVFDYKKYLSTKLQFTFVKGSCSCNNKHIRNYQNGVTVTVWHHSYCNGSAKRGTQCPPQIEIRKKGFELLKRSFPSTAKQFREIVNRYVE